MLSRRRAPGFEEISPPPPFSCERPFDGLTTSLLFFQRQDKSPSSAHSRSDTDSTTTRRLCRTSVSEILAGNRRNALRSAPQSLPSSPIGSLCKAGCQDQHPSQPCLFRSTNPRAQQESVPKYTETHSDGASHENLAHWTDTTSRSSVCLQVVSTVSRRKQALPSLASLPASPPTNAQHQSIPPDISFSSSLPG